MHPVSDSLAQLVEHDTLNVGVQGSIPLHPVSDSLAQLVEHDTLNVGVQGSIPWRVTRSGDGLSGSAFLLYGALFSVCFKE